MLCTALLMETGCVRHREVRAFAQGHTALQAHHPVSLSGDLPSSVQLSIRVRGLRWELFAEMLPQGARAVTVGYRWGELSYLSSGLLILFFFLVIPFLRGVNHLLGV